MHTNKATIRRAWLLLRWVIICRCIISVCDQPPRPAQPFISGDGKWVPVPVKICWCCTPAK